MSKIQCVGLNDENKSNEKMLSDLLRMCETCVKTALFESVLSVKDYSNDLLKPIFKIMYL